MACVAVSAAVLLLASAFPASAGILKGKKGEGGSEIQGAAGTDGAQGAASDLQKCDKPMGAVAVVEPQDVVYHSLSRYGLQSPVPLIRMMIQQSNCFLVVERGAGMQNLMQERQLAESGELRSGSNMGGGQMVTADFVLTPNVVFSEGNAGGAAAGLGGLLRGKAGLAAGAVAGGLKFKEAQTSMLLADARSGLQVAAAEGSTKKADIRAGGVLWGGGAVGALGGYTNTNEGKIIAAAFLDNYNNVVNVVRGDPSLQRDVGTLKEEAGKKTKAGAVYEEGDLLLPRIDGVKVYAEPSESAKVVKTLQKGDEMIYLGEEKEGFLKVEGAGAGWVKKVMVGR
jgi:hypothetical protein